ncbi:MAG TPA: hypothetical protein EYP56_06260 [Planctomycetaceae bacterium]|nr:hypothetical protein [Planctomycetaceae bacterium]
MTLRTWIVVLSTLAVANSSPAAEAGRDVTRTFQIDLSTRETMKMQDWSGRARIDKGRIVRVEKTSGTVDQIHPDMSWTIVYGRSLRAQPRRRPRPKALLITVQAPPDATVTVDTAAGTFSFRVGELTGGKLLKRLEGNVTISVARAGRARRGRRPPLPPATVAGQIPAERITDGRLQSEWPAVAVAPSGAIWLAFVQWNGKDKDRVLLIRRPPGGEWSDPIHLDDGGWDHYWPAVAAVGEEAVVVWSSQQEGNFDLYWCKVRPDGIASAPQRLDGSPQSDFQARMVGDGREAVTLVWQSFRQGQSDILARRFQGGRWGPELRVSPSEANDWQPDIAVDTDGTAWISWDSYHSGNYDVFLRRLDQSGLGPVIRVTSEPTAQFHSTVAVDRHGRVWVAWDDGGPNWGKDLSASSAAPGYQGLHAQRSISLRVYAQGQLWEPAAQPRQVMTGMMQRYAELPQLAVDGRGTLWLVFRHWTIRKPTEMFHIYATRLDEEGWTTPWRLADSSGRNTQWVSLARRPDGSLLVAYASDGRAPDNLPKDQVHALVYTLYAATLEEAGGMPEVKLAKVELPEPTGRWMRRQRPTMTVGNKTYTLVLGDCHRHTDIRGHSGVDASILDTFRYALDAGRLDFMGLGDHNEVFGGRWPDGLRDYQWWWTQKAVDLFTCPPTFVGLYSYEHSMSSPAGHRNLIFLKRGAPLRMIDRSAKVKPNPGNLPPELWKWVQQNVLTQPGQKCVIVPHTFAAGPLAEWNWPNAPFDTLLEIYQGCRGSYEKWGLPPGEKRGGTQTKRPGHFAQDALARGNLYGFVSFSDHRSTHNSWAGVWVDRPSREGIINAMLARRTYGASDEIIVKLTAGQRHTMGEMFEASAAAPPALEIDIQAPDEIRRVDIVKNGNYIYTTDPEGRRFQTTFRDFDVSPGKAYYYVRVFQRDPEAPEGDPEIAWTSPIFVTYKE